MATETKRVSEQAWALLAILVADKRACLKHPQCSVITAKDISAILVELKNLGAQVDEDDIRQLGGGYEYDVLARVVLSMYLSRMDLAGMFSWDTPNLDEEHRREGWSKLAWALREYGSAVGDVARAIGLF